MPQIREVGPASSRLRRVFGHRDVPLFDPSLMLDVFKPDLPRTISPVFPGSCTTALRRSPSCLTGG
ncbi:hypothetical protein [uncultured Methanofollis sp.]|uniref:hypothetical protein n=1 Tax=uncultured Methanofollis sp. TaxID=262500 RepID=UPI00260D0220|nr:hypothetical protein [uncultured Methanofollis sp.]